MISFGREQNCRHLDLPVLILFSETLTLIDLSCLPKVNVVFPSHCNSYTIFLSVYVLLHIYIAHERQFFLTHITCQMEIPALLDSWGKSTPSIKMLCPQKMISLVGFVKT